MIPTVWQQPQVYGLTYHIPDPNRSNQKHFSPAATLAWGQKSFPISGEGFPQIVDVLRRARLGEKRVGAHLIRLIHFFEFLKTSESDNQRRF